MKPEIRHCTDIGMFAVDRPIPNGCFHRTNYCNLHCYNVKLYRIYPGMKGKDERNEAAWLSCSGSDYAKALDRKRKPTDRFRLMTRGEAFNTAADVTRVVEIATAMPDRLIWIPTRGWRDPLIRALIEGLVMPLPNVAVLASLDPSNSESEYRDLVSAGWPTMFFGDGSGWTGPDHGFNCPKTTHTRANPKGIKGHCGDCKAGCFAGPILNRRVDVILSQH